MSSATTRYALFAFGPDLAVHCQAYLALLTTMAHAAPGSEFVMVTDRPTYYRWFGSRVSTIAVDEATLESWRGPHRFFWRMKMMAIRTASGGSPAHLIYLDSDVLARRPLAELSTGLAAGEVYMHMRESVFGASRRSRERALVRQLIGRDFAGFTITPATQMWNAGIVAVGAERLGLLDQAIDLCDAMCAQAQSVLLEQLAFSVALGAGGNLHPAAAWFDHYWGNKRGFLESGTAQLATILIRGLDVDGAVAWVAGNPIVRPLAVRRRWWNRYFQGLAGSRF